MGERPSSRRWLGLLVVCCVSVFLGRSSALPLTQAVHSAQLVGSNSSFTGAAFVPSVAPVVAARVGSSGVDLSWGRVVTSGGGGVAYRVVRTGPTGTTEVCTAGNAPVVVGSLVGCSDPAVVADASYTYAQQPLLVRNSTVTWSRPLSDPSTTVVGPRIVFANVGVTVTSTGGSVVVPYPDGTQVGDVLVLVSVSGRQNAPSIPSGWTALANMGLSGGSAMRFFVAWRLADGASSLSWNPSANATGASVRVVRYRRGNGNLATPTLATAQVASGSGASGSRFTPSPDVVTTSNNAQVVSLVAVRSATTLSLATPRSFGIDGSDSVTPGTVGHAVGIGGAQMVVAGQVASPTWQSAAAGAWVSATFAFS